MRKQRKSKVSSTDAARKFAKRGMIVSLLAAAGTAFCRNNKKARYLHIASGAALIGFSYWHHSLYRKEPDGVRVEVRQGGYTRQVEGLED